MSIDLSARAEAMPLAWRSELLAKIGSANVKVLRMDASGFAREVHDYDEAVLVLDGRLVIEVESRIVTVEAGGFLLIPAGVHHAGTPECRGTLLIIDV